MSSAQLVFKRYETKHLLDAERPAYKEKTRTRCYGTPHPFDPVFVELKKNATGSFISVAAALALGFALAAVHQVRNRSTRSLSCTLAVLPAIVYVVIALVNGNVGTGVVVAGAFSLARFRSVPGSARDMGFVFLAVRVGLACGMGYLGVAALTAFAGGGAYLT